MKTYLVGGAVRDELMGMPSSDHDYVVVGASEADMLARGFKKVGADFPVFMDENGDQYALARKERKTGAGYLGFETTFDPSVTLEDDLRRRDLTINAIAKDVDTGEIVDPFNGRQDLELGLLRHVSEAFAEDPLRVIRLARFYARWPKFDVAQDTIELARSIVKSGEMDALSDERYYAEIEKMFSQSDQPSRFFSALMALGVWRWQGFMHDDRAGIRSTVKFMDDLFGTILYDMHDVLRFADAVKRAEPGTQTSFFVAVVAGNARQASPAIPAYTKKLTQAMRKLNDCRQTAEHLHALLHSVRGFDADSPAANDLTKIMALGESIGLEWPFEAQQYSTAKSFAQSVKADKFMHLAGPEIGKAMTAARIATMRNVIGA